MSNIAEATIFFDKWCGHVILESNMPAFIKFATAAKTHKKGIFSFVKSKITHGIVERLNCKIPLAKKKSKRLFKDKDF